MADYQQQTISGSSYQRAARIVIENPRNALPSATFVEEKVVMTGETSTALPAGVFAITISDFAEVINLRDPTTWELTGTTTTMGELYTALASVYWQKALDRDAGLLNVEGEGGPI